MRVYHAVQSAAPPALREATERQLADYYIINSLCDKQQLASKPGPEIHACAAGLCVFVCVCVDVHPLHVQAHTHMCTHTYAHTDAWQREQSPAAEYT